MKSNKARLGVLLAVVVALAGAVFYMNYDPAPRVAGRAGAGGSDAAAAQPADQPGTQGRPSGASGSEGTPPEQSPHGGYSG